MVYIQRDLIALFGQTKANGDADLVYKDATDLGQDVLRLLALDLQAHGLFHLFQHSLAHGGAQGQGRFAQQVPQPFFQAIDDHGVDARQISLFLFFGCHGSPRLVEIGFLFSS